MQIAPVRANEAARIARLRLLNILDSQPEERFDRLTRITKRLFSVPIAQVTLVDTDRQWFKSSAGAPRGETSRDVSFCAHAILNDEIMHVPDARADERFVDNPLVMGAPNIHFYAGCPLRIGDDNLGTLCVIDDKAHEFGDEERKLLRDLAEMAEQELAALQTATTDHLTGLSNRRGFEILARHTLNVCKRLQRPLTLLYFDLNRFKWINDVLGHAEGDFALKRFAHALLAVFRDSDVVGRLGGDEFAVLLTGTPMETAHVAVERLTAWLQDADRAEPRGYAIECSSGECEFDVERHDSIEDLLADADQAMYAHKAASRPGHDTNASRAAHASASDSRTEAASIQ